MKLWLILKKITKNLTKSFLPQLFFVRIEHTSLDNKKLTFFSRFKKKLSLHLPCLSLLVFIYLSNMTASFDELDIIIIIIIMLLNELTWHPIFSKSTTSQTSQQPTCHYIIQSHLFMHSEWKFVQLYFIKYHYWIASSGPFALLEKQKNSTKN